MRFACLTTVAPGKDLSAQCAAIAAAGCTGVEAIIFPDTPLDAWQIDLGCAAAAAGLQPAAVIVGGLALYQAGQMPWVREALHAIAELGAIALLTPEYRAQDPLPIFPPYQLPPPEEQDQVNAALAEISMIAAQHNLRVALEPLTPFESRFWRDVAAVLEVCRQLENPRIGVALDFHNLNITESQIDASIQAAGAWIAHVHLADNNRRLPGYGHIDFAAGLAALRAVGYTGWYSFECAIDVPFALNLQQAMDMLQRC